MSKAQAARAHQAFYDMIDQRDAAKRARRPTVPVGEPVTVLVIVPVVLPMSEIHAAADRLMDTPEYQAHARMLDAMLADMLLDPLPDVPIKD
ncbi:hypothetical protein EOS_32995 [Caballeronia mineralivorans PML1(12)]|uniref:Uncharacterized protein n=1 Tax=Caballeronia mineralivorans PML1(12) TaxID=908627 RepID=A0A0J1CNI9_9BURK|nr:hypothetical protein [Caballeronia mineralivorans]KLU21961.1 hypothetical protein EOS_32995 [Caballeronia mineralivorans PML1(12)]